MNLFPVGSEVVVKTLGNKRGVVVHISAAGRYRVQVAAVMLWCREADLETPPPASRKSRKHASRDRLRANADSNVSPAVRVDLHGLTVEDALARLMDAIEHAIQRGADRVEVVHGKGTGRVKRAVHRRLASLPSVVSFKLDELNDGVTWAFL